MFYRGLCFSGIMDYMLYTFENIVPLMDALEGVSCVVSIITIDNQLKGTRARFGH